jgi:hypothetical protein
LLVGREDLEDEIGDNEIEGGEIGGDKEDVETADCEKFLFNYVNRCAVSVYSANLIIDKITIEITNIY